MNICLAVTTIFDVMQDGSTRHTESTVFQSVQGRDDRMKTDMLEHAIELSD